MVNDVTQRDKYDKIDFTEFLEMIGRIAHVIYKDEPGMRDRSFEDKLEKVLE